MEGVKSFLPFPPSQVIKDGKKVIKEMKEFYDVSFTLPI